MKQEEYHLIEALYIENFNSLYQYAYSAIRDRCVAENLVNDTFLQAIKKSAKILQHENPLGWLRTALKFNIRQYIRSLKRLPYTLPLADAEEQCIAQKSLDYDAELLLASIASVLSRDDFCLFVRFYKDGYSHGQLAKEFGISVSASQKRLERIRKRLKQVLGER